MTGYDVLDALDEVISEAFCTGCPARRLLRGKTDGGMPVEPDEEICPAGFDYTDARCERSTEYGELAERAEEIAALLSELETGDKSHVDEMY